MGCWGWRPIKDGYAPGMRQALLYPRIRKTLNTLDLGSGVRGGAPSMRPLLPFLIATFLCWSPDLTGTRPDLEQGYATRVCAGDETPLGLPRRPSTKTRYAPGMRRPHSFAADLDPAGDGLTQVCGLNPDSAQTLITLRYLCAGVCAVYIYSVWEFISGLCARVCVPYIYAKSNIALQPLAYFSYPNLCKSPYSRHMVGYMVIICSRYGRYRVGVRSM